MRLDTKQLDEIVGAQADPEPFSGVVSLARQGTVVFEKAYGLAIRTEAIPNEVNTRFQVASGSKILTAVAVCQLMEDSDLTPETRVRAYLDIDLPNVDDEVSIHQLLTHTSGIADYFDEKKHGTTDYPSLWAERPTYTMREPSDFVPLFRDIPANSGPGETFSYSNAGYILLGLIVAKASGQAFSAYVEKEIMSRCGMHRSGYYTMDKLPPRTALSYICEDDGTYRSNMFAVPVVGGADGGAYVTAQDMASFWGSLIGEQLLSPESTEQLLSPHVETSMKAPQTHYGYGVWIDQPEHSVRKYFVEGADPGVACRSAYYPRDEAMLTVIGNTQRALWPLYGKLEKSLAL